MDNKDLRLNRLRRLNRLVWVDVCLIWGGALGNMATMLGITLVLLAAGLPESIVAGALYVTGAANILMACYIGLRFNWGRDYPEKPPEGGPFGEAAIAFGFSFIQLLFFIGWIDFVRNTIRNYRQHQ